VPCVGAAARILHFGGEREPCVVIAVEEQGRRLRVRDQADGMREFVLSPATATFIAVESRYGARLELLA
jgi:hypothetical protein